MIRIQIFLLFAGFTVFISSGTALGQDPAGAHAPVKLVYAQPG